MSTSSTEQKEIPLPEKFHARIVGKVQHRVGDGPLEAIPVGQEVEVNVALASMVLSWTSEEQPVTVTLARAEFFHYLNEGGLQILE